MFGVWTGYGRDVYAVVIDEKWPNFFGLYRRGIPDNEALARALEALDRRGGQRNEELGEALVADGWTQVLPLSDKS
jgi:hypothetical protein